MSALYSFLPASDTRPRHAGLLLVGVHRLCLNPAIEKPEEHSSAAPDSHFNSTPWSVVLSAGGEPSPTSQAALEKLCRTYLRPLQAFARQLGHNEHDAQDLAQGFFARFPEKGYVHAADPERGRFRTFLKTSFQHFIQAEWIKAHAAKRGGAQSVLSLDALSTAEQEAVIKPVDDTGACAVFDRQWAAEVLSRSITRLREEFAAAGKDKDFQAES